MKTIAKISSQSKLETGHFPTTTYVSFNNFTDAMQKKQVSGKSQSF